MATDGYRNPLARQRIRLGLFAVFGLGFLALAIPAFAEPMTFWTGIILGDYAYPMHELHHFVLGSVLTLLLLGVIAQAIQPTHRVGALHSAVLIWLSLTLVFIITGEVAMVHFVLLGLLVGMVATHPAGVNQFPTFEPPAPVMLLVTVVTVIGAVALAGIEIQAQLAVVDDHTVLGHYQFMATTAVSIAALTLYGSLRGIGWRFPIYGAVMLMSVIGIGSIAYPGPEQGSSLGVGLGILVIVWAGIVVLTAERPDRMSEPLNQ